jgi:hypothetical protein
MSTVTSRQRLMLQIEYVDTMVSALIDRLQAVEMLDDTLLVIVADHGSDITSGRNGRGDLREDELQGPIASGGVEIEDAVLPIPLFVKYPGQTSSVVDDRNAKSIDVLPTIADVLGTQLPPDWEFDGRSLLADPPVDDHPREWIRHHCSCTEELSARPEPTRVALVNEALFGSFRDEHDIYAVGPHRSLVGSTVESAGAPVPGASIVNQDPDALDDVDLDAATIPVRFAGDVMGLDSGSWVALAIDDVIAGIGPVYLDHEDRTVVEIMIDPALMRDGQNEARMYLVDEGSELRPVASS